MKYYTITVNGNTYEVSVEESSTSGVSYAAPAPKAPVTPAPKAPIQQSEPVAKSAPAPVASGSAGNIKVSSPMPGKIISIIANVGTTVKKGEVILILEAMKMENEIVAPEDGTVSSINVSSGQSVEAGDLLATMN
ncbi:MAG: biotin/lipoyl-binding protein [Clostridiales bacterium]|nr:biotin/lipoyl-binding protein [Clostridiales bacterium]